MPSNSYVAFDPLAILSALREIEYLVVGGFAAVLYGAPTTTGGLVIMPLDEDRNIAGLAAVLARFEAVVREPPGTGRALPVTLDLLRATARKPEPGGQLLTRTSAGPLDILWRLHDGRGYGDLVAASTVLTEEELRVRVVSLDDLIQIKSSVGRDRDRAVLPYLSQIRHRQ